MSALPAIATAGRFRLGGPPAEGAALRRAVRLAFSSASCANEVALPPPKSWSKMEGAGTGAAVAALRPSSDGVVARGIVTDAAASEPPNSPNQRGQPKPKPKP